MSDWTLLTEPERKLLQQIDSWQGTATPGGLAQGGGWKAVQSVVRAAGGLKDMGLIRIIRLPKMTYYELSSAGREALKEAGT